MSTIKSSTTLTTAYQVVADTTGALVIQTGATPTTAVTVSSAQVVTLAQPLPAASGGTGLTSPGTTNNVLTSNGTAWVSSAPAAGGFSNMVVLTSTNASYSIPATKIKVTVVGGGSGGRSDIACEIFGGGGGGGAAIKILSGLTIGNTLNITIGAGGAANAAGGTTSIASGTQSISTISATGGALPGDSNYYLAGGPGGLGSGGDLNIKGCAGTPGIPTGGAVGGSGGSSILGGGGAGRAGAGQAGGAYGGGGGSPGASGGSAGAGAAGVVVVEY